MAPRAQQRRIVDPTSNGGVGGRRPHDRTQDRTGLEEVNWSKRLRALRLSRSSLRVIAAISVQRPCEINFLRSAASRARAREPGRKRRIQVVTEAHLLYRRDARSRESRGVCILEIARSDSCIFGGDLDSRCTENIIIKLCVHLIIKLSLEQRERCRAVK